MPELPVFRQCYSFVQLPGVLHGILYAVQAALSWFVARNVKVH